MAKVAERLAVLGQTVRLRLVEQLAARSATPQGLADALGLSQQNVFRHLQILHGCQPGLAGAAHDHDFRASAYEPMADRSFRSRSRRRTIEG